MWASLFVAWRRYCKMRTCSSGATAWISCYVSRHWTDRSSGEHRNWDIADASESETQDQELLVRAACAVVLQREVSLSRRVYTWLLGKGESPEKQIAYFRTYGLEILSKVLKVSFIYA